MGMYILYALGGVLVVGVAIWIINKKYLQTQFQIVKANLGEAARNAEANNALKLMKQGIEECTEQVKKSKTGLVKVQSSITGLERQVKTGTSEEARLTARIKQGIAEGKTDTDPVMVQLATSLKRVREDLKSNKEQLETQHGVYNDLLAQIQNAQRRAETLEREAESLGAQLETSKLTAELADFANTFDAKGVSSRLDGVAKYRDLVRKQIDQNNAKLKVNKDLGATGQEVQTFEDHQDAKDILAELRGGGNA
jgi:phage shock protein A